MKPNESFKRHGVQEAPAMTTRKNILAAMVGLAMLAMPVRALAGDHHHRDWDDNPRPQTWHDQGWHNGWYKNHGDRDDYRYAQPVWHHEEDENEDCDDDGGGYYGGNYGAPYYGKSLGQLMVDRQNEYRTYINLLNRHDSRAANRYWRLVLHPTDQRIAALNGGYVPPSPGFLGGPVNWGNGTYNAYPYGSGYNNGYYGNNGNNPMGALGALVGPLLGVTP